MVVESNNTSCFALEHVVELSGTACDSEKNMLGQCRGGDLSHVETCLGRISTARECAAVQKCEYRDGVRCIDGGGTSNTAHKVCRDRVHRWAGL